MTALISPYMKRSEVSALDRSMDAIFETYLWKKPIRKYEKKKDSYDSHNLLDPERPHSNNMHLPRVVECSLSYRDAERKVLHPYITFGSEAFLCRLPVFIWSLQGLADPCKRINVQAPKHFAYFAGYFCAPMAAHLT